jgi:hypothetical protein
MPSKCGAVASEERERARIRVLMDEQNPLLAGYRPPPKPLAVRAEEMRKDVENGGV